eukprot:GHVU01174133.1.p1 GENE.GHVU01174133.1~~GHVU01174133.1.p1  ORF type:complete len:352 (+),score=43.53 GHVU01174133.1:697-1752(+)
MKKGVADGLQAHVNRVAALGSDRAAIAEQWLSSCLCRRCCDEGEGAMLPNCSKATHVLSVCASNPIVLSCLLKIDVDAAALLIQNASRTAAPTSFSALRLVSDEASSRVSSGSAEFDAACLEGGLLGGLVYEYVGAGGVGKSCWCYSAVAHILSSQDTGIVVWVDTEKKFSAQRLLQIVDAHREALTGARADNRGRLERLRVVALTTLSEVTVAAKAVETAAAPTPGTELKLVVVDSVAAAARVEYGLLGGNSIVDRQASLNQLAELLKAIGAKARVPILVTNQISGAKRPGADAALGNTWFHAVNVRCHMSLELKGEPESRIVHVLKSPYMGQNCFRFCITERGIESRRN